MGAGSASDFEKLSEELINPPKKSHWDKIVEQDAENQIKKRERRKRKYEKLHNKKEEIAPKPIPKPVQSTQIEQKQSFIVRKPNQASPMRKNIMQSSPLRRGCSNVYDISFDGEDDLETLSQVGQDGLVK